MKIVKHFLIIYHESKLLCYYYELWKIKEKELKKSCENKNKNISNNDYNNHLYMLMNEKYILREVF